MGNTNGKRLAPVSKIQLDTPNEQQLSEKNFAKIKTSGEGLYCLMHSIFGEYKEGSRFYNKQSGFYNKQ